MQQRVWDVVPGVGVGPLRFGTAREALRTAWGPYRAFRRGAYSADLTDQYADAALMLTCSSREGLYMIEIPDPDGVRYQRVDLAGEVKTVLDELRAAGVEPIADESGWHFGDGAVALYTSSTEPRAMVEAVTAFGPGHELGAQLAPIAAGDAAVSLPNRYRILSNGRGLDAVRFGETRTEVRRRMRGGLCWQHRAGSREAVQDSFFEDGLVVQYGPDALVERIVVTRSDEVMLDDINLMPAYPHTVNEVRSALAAAGHVLHDGEATLIITGTGIEVWTARASAHQALPVCGVSLSPIGPAAPISQANLTLF
ncbi:hypothetical protein [Micromonospora sp. NPDC005806]|uniref:hypothetical protein n=1 Tax=Micromonospora sp. NPDC005806 TaxID=3364234 RepID=UPI003698382D